ncbi:MAG: amidohydrolase family protein [Syntrophales bacterium]|nr:amidohydrolase family protein [Syntrophales bacterium]
MKIDSHVVVGPFIGEMGEPGYPDIRLSIDELIEILDKAKIDKAVVFPAAEWNADPSISQLQANEAMASAISKYPDRLIGFGRVNPYFKHSLKDAEKMIKDLGFKGLGEFHPIVDSFAANSTIMHPFMEMAGALNIPIKMHSGMGRAALPSLVGDLASKFPKVTVIMCHMGCWEWPEAIIVAKNVPNIVLEHCAGPSLYPSGRYGALKKAVTEVGADRVIWGSDEPYCDMFMALREVEACSFTKEQEKLVMGENIARILW